MQLRFYRGTWCAYWRVPDGKGGTSPKRTSLRTADRDEAQRRLKDFEAESKAPAVLIDDIFPAYLEEKKDSGGIKSTKLNWKTLQPHFGHLRPDQVTVAECKKYNEKRTEQGVGANQVHREVSMLRAAINWHDPNNAARFWLPQRPPPSERYLTKEEYQKLLKGASAPHVRLFIVLALATAGRAGAILELKWDQVDFERGLIRLGKGETHRRKGRATVPMTERARRALEEAYKGRVTDWVIEYGGGPIKSISKGVERATKRAGLEDVSPHVLRHTAAVWMAEDNISMEVIAQYLGHTDSRITARVYARFSPSYLKQAASSLDD